MKCAAFVVIALVAVALAASGAEARRHKQGVLAHKVHHKRHHAKALAHEEPAPAAEEPAPAAEDAAAADNGDGDAVVDAGESVGEGSIDAPDNLLYIEDPELKPLFTEGKGRIKQVGPGELAVNAVDETGAVQPFTVPEDPDKPADENDDPDDPTPQPPEQMSKTEVASTLSKLAKYLGGGSPEAPSDEAVAAPAEAANDGAAAAPVPTAFAALSEVLRVKHKEEPSGMKCNPDGSVTIDESQCPEPDCPPCDGGAGEKKVKPIRGIRVLEYAPNDYPFGSPKVIAESGLNAKLATQVRGVLNGEIGKKAKAIANEISVEDRSAARDQEAKELEELQARKEQIKFMHMTPEEKVEKALLKVLDSMGIQPTEVIQTPVI